MQRCEKNHLNSNACGKLIDLTQIARSPIQSRLIRRLQQPIETLLCIQQINAIYQESILNRSPAEFFEKTLEALQISHAVSDEDLHKIPASGPLVAVANHPFGGLEGLVLGKLLLSRRSDVKILGNYLLQHIPELQDRIIPVDPFGRRSSTLANARAYIRAIHWLNAGGALVTFPAGEVSHWSLSRTRISDPPWSPHIAALIRKTGAKALPIYFPGRNSLLFNFLGVFHPRFRTLMLPHELMRKSDSTLQLHIGKALTFDKLSRYAGDAEMIAYLRFSTYFLRHRAARRTAVFPVSKILRPKKMRTEAIIPAVPRECLAAEVTALPSECLLAAQKEMAVYVAGASRIPLCLREIGRLREMSFRDVGEGSGKSQDTDRFDLHYDHLFLWNRQTHEIAGAYRIGRVDRILDRCGPQGLYTNTLFRFKSIFLSHMRNALELGRSFIRTEYQRKHNCLALLWRGIGEFISRRPRYRVLFGPVSISQRYHTVSKNLMVEFLRKAHADTDFAGLVKPRRPYKPRPGRGVRPDKSFFYPESIEDVSMLISEIESDGKGIPTLIKHYLKLDAGFICFNVDKRFSNVVDGLVVVDLSGTEPRMLKRFMTESGFERFVRYGTGPNSRAA